MSRRNESRPGRKPSGPAGPRECQTQFYRWLVSTPRCRSGLGCRPVPGPRSTCDTDQNAAHKQRKLIHREQLDHGVALQLRSIQRQTDLRAGIDRQNRVEARAPGPLALEQAVANTTRGTRYDAGTLRGRTMEPPVPAADSVAAGRSTASLTTASHTPARSSSSAT